MSGAVRAGSRGKLYAREVLNADMGAVPEPSNTCSMHCFGSPDFGCADNACATSQRGPIRSLCGASGFVAGFVSKDVELDNPYQKREPRKAVGINTKLYIQLHAPRSEPSVS